MTTDTPIYGWHFAKFDGTDARQSYRKRPIIVPGGTEMEKATPILCERGLHGAVRAIDALRYAKGPMIRWCQFGGKVIHGDDKLAAQTRTEVWRADANRTLREFAIWCGEQALEREQAAGREPHPDSWAVLTAARQYLAGAIGLPALRHAHAAADAAAAAADAAAADAAADAAAAAAAYAAAAAAAYAAADAAAAAAHAAAYAAAAARERMRDEQNTKLTEMLNSLRPEAVPAS